MPFSEQKLKSESKILPLVPLRDTVLFPGMSLPVVVGRDKFLAALKAGFNLGRQIILTCQNNPDVEDPNYKDIYNVGVLARIVDVSQLDRQPVQAFIEVLERVKIAELIRLEPYAEARFDFQKSEASKNASE